MGMARMHTQEDRRGIDGETPIERERRVSIERRVEALERFGERAPTPAARVVLRDAPCVDEAALRRALGLVLAPELGGGVPRERLAEAAAVLAHAVSRGCPASMHGDVVAALRRLAAVAYPGWPGGDVVTWIASRAAEASRAPAGAYGSWGLSRRERELRLAELLARAMDVQRRTT